jgi:hypothetical protein
MSSVGIYHLVGKFVSSLLESKQERRILLDIMMLCELAKQRVPK